MPDSDVVKKYHTKCTGAALETVERHGGEAPYTLFAAVFCPFVQRVWTALEFYGIPYKVRGQLYLVFKRRINLVTTVL